MCELAGPLHVFLRVRVCHRGLEVLPAAPLRVVDDSGAVQAAVQVCRDEARTVPHNFLRRVFEELDQLVLGSSVHVENIDQDHWPVAGSDHGFTFGHAATVASDTDTVSGFRGRKPAVRWSIRL